MQHGNANVVVGLCIIIIALIVILALVGCNWMLYVLPCYIYHLVLPQVIVLGGALWMWSGADSEYMRKSVSVWRNSDVVSWVEGLGHWTQPNITKIFINEVCNVSLI